MRIRTTTRREFLKKTAGAAVSGPLVLTSLTRRAGAAPANERIALGIIGPGQQGFGLLKRFMRIPEVQMVAACDVSMTRRGYAAKVINEHYAEARKAGSFQGAKAYRDFRDLLAIQDIDAVVIAVPDHWHAIVAMTACKAGKDVYCEKPLSLTIHEAHQMMLAARKYDRVFQTGSQQRTEFNGYFRRACELVRNGRIGKIEKVLVSVKVTNWIEHSKPCDLPSEPVPAGFDWDFWLGPAPQRGYNKILAPAGIPDEPPDDQKDKIAWYKNYPDWRNYREFSGGSMTDFGAHHFDIAQWGLAMDDSGPVEVIPAKDGQPMTFKYPNGVIMEKVDDINGEAEGSHGVKFIGSEGWVEVTREFLHTKPENLVDKPVPPDGVHFPEVEDHKRDFIDCVMSRKRPIADVEIGARSVTVCHLGNLAYWHNKTLRWDPKNWRFANEEDNRLLDRPKRAPWTLPAL